MKRAPVPDLIPLGWFDLDDVGTVVAEHLRAVRPAKNPRAVHDLYPGSAPPDWVHLSARTSLPPGPSSTEGLPVDLSRSRTGVERKPLGPDHAGRQSVRRTHGIRNAKHATRNRRLPAKAQGSP